MDKQKLKQLIIEAVSEVEGAEIYRSYSGRRMYDKECLGIDISDKYHTSGVLMRVMAQLSRKDKEAANAFMDLVDKRMREDALGKGVIVYFPSIEDNYLDYKAEMETAVANFATEQEA